MAQAADKASAKGKAKEENKEIAAAPSDAKPAKAKSNGKNGKKSAKQRIKFESHLPTEEAVAYFEAIVTGLKKGRVQFNQAGESLSFDLPAHLDVEVKASRSGDKEKVVFELAWHADDTADLTVSSK